MSIDLENDLVSLRVLGELAEDLAVDAECGSAKAFERLHVTLSAIRDRIDSATRNAGAR